MCDVLGTLRQREFGWTCSIVDRDLKQLRILLGLLWKEVILGYFLTLESLIVTDC